MVRKIIITYTISFLKRYKQEFALLGVWIIILSCYLIVRVDLQRIAQDSININTFQECIDIAVRSSLTHISLLIVYILSLITLFATYKHIFKKVGGLNNR